MTLARLLEIETDDTPPVDCMIEMAAEIRRLWGALRCPKCGATEADMKFRIDETVWCLACDWEGHEDDTVVEEAHEDKN